MLENTLNNPGAPVIYLDRVTKHYDLFDRPQDRLKQLLFGRWRQWGRRFFATQNLSLQISGGEVVGIIGRNGAGKSTLLQLVCGTLTPSSGERRVNGRVASLLELGAGFNPEFSGRENIYLNAAILGLSRDETEARFADIVAFSEIGEFLDQPVKTYSSGMYVRLGFAIAAFMEPEILLVDEVLAVGDGRFQEKCYDHIASLRERGVTIVMVSHDLGAVERFSTRAALMERGRMVRIGDPHEIVQHHLERLITTSPEIRRALDEAIEEHPELLEAVAFSSPEAQAVFERELEANPAFHAALAEKVAREGVPAHRAPRVGSDPDRDGEADEATSAGEQHQR